jgi:hypothetical protein
MIFKNTFPAVKKTYSVFITKTTILMLFRGRNPVHCENKQIESNVVKMEISLMLKQNMYIVMLCIKGSRVWF